MPKKKILIIDDEPSIIKSIEKILKDLPYELQTAQNGSDGIAILKNWTPDLILLDLMMPQMSGIEFLKAVKLDPDSPYAVIILSGHGNDEEMLQCYQLGAHFFMRKPFGISDLTCLVTRCLTFKELEHDSRQYRSYLEESVKLQNTYISKLSLALDQSSTAVIMSDKLRRITYINASYSRTSGFHWQDLQGKDLLSIFNSDDRHVLEDIKQHMDSGVSWKGELCSRRSNGQSYWVASSISPIKNNAGEITNFIVIQDDITLRKDAELEKDRLAQLSEHQRLLKQNFSNNMTHELLTPVHIIATAASVIDSKMTDDSVRKYIHYIQNATEDLIFRSAMVLNMKRLETGTLAPQMQKFPLKQLIVDITQTQQPAAALKNLQLEYRLDGNVPEYLTCDGKFLMQIIAYLIENAIKFTKSGQITVSAKKVKDNAQPGFRFEVTDTGIGIAKSKLQMIFEPFQQADSSSSRSYRGMGLGLTLAQNLAKAIGGKISVNSAEGNGSTFTLTLPVSTTSTVSA